VLIQPSLKLVNTTTMRASGESMRASVLLGILLVFGFVARESAAQSGEVQCPKPGTRLTFSDGGQIEAVSDEGNYVCRFKSLKTQKTFDRLFGAFAPTGPNANQIRSLAPFKVGRKVSFTNSGADVRGGDGFWFHEVAIERFEDVVTDAGTFRSFVILYDDQAIQSSHGRWQRRYWYSPEMNFVVKFQYLTLHGNPPPNYPKDWELTAYEPGAAKPAVARPAPPPPVLAGPPVQAPAPQPMSKPVEIVAASPPPAVEPPKVATAVAVPSSQDGTWQMDMHVTTTYGTTVGGECQARPTIPLTFVNGSADGPLAKLRLTGDGRISGWLQVPSIGTTMLPFIVDVSGKFENGAFGGSVSGRCTGSFTMSKQ
jgi:hypothetical protein